MSVLVKFHDIFHTAVKYFAKHLYAFYNCSSLTSITLPEGLKRLDDEVFSGCSSLTSVTFLGSDVEMGWDVFVDCPNLKTIYAPKDSEIEQWAKSEGYNVLNTLPSE